MMSYNVNDRVVYGVTGSTSALCPQRLIIKAGKTEIRIGVMQ